MGFKQMTQFEDCRLVADCVTAKVQSSERAHRPDVVAGSESWYDCWGK